MNRNNYTLNFDASLDISQIRSAVAEMQKAFSKIKLSQGLDLNIKETFSNLSNEIANFEELTSKSFHSLSEIGEVSKSFQKILDYYKRLNKYELQITGKDASDFFPKDLVDIISGAEKAVKNYEKALNSIPTQIQKQTRAIEEQEQALNSLIEKRNDLASENRNLSISRSGLTQKISTKQVEQADISNRMQIAQDSGVKKSSEEYKALVAQYKAVSAEIKSLETELSSLDNKISKNHETMEGLGTQVSSTGSKILELKQELERMGSSLEFEALTKLRTELAQITKQDISQIPRDIQEIKNMINGLSAEELKKIEQAFNEIHTSVENTEAPLQKAKGDIEKLGESGRSIANTADEINNLKNQVLDFFSLSNAVNLFQRALSSALDTVKELDATMTEAAVVTDFSVGDMWNQLPVYSEEATKLGATINDLYGATTLYYQQGLKTNEAMALGIETTKMARIANMETADATDLMTAALRGFNMELNETSAQRINDVYSELAAVTAADTEEIGIAMSKTASLAASANMEFETTAAFLSQIIETTREAPETAGTALKTIVARFTEVKELFSQGELMGEDSEGQEININKIDEALKTVGISLNEFLLGSKGLDDILLELASKWDTLDIATQRYIATTAAGSRQQSRFLAMMSDYDRTMELVDAAYNSTGASQEQFEKTLDSLESKLNNLKNAWDQFTMGILDNNVIKFGVDLLTQLLNAINNITEALPGPLSGLAKIGIAIGGLKVGKSIFNSLFNSIGKAFLEGGEKAGNEFKKGLEKTVDKSFRNVSTKARAGAKSVLRALNVEFAKGNVNTFDGLVQAFNKTGDSLEQYAGDISKNIVSAITNSLGKLNLSKEGQEAALDFLIAFEKEVADGSNIDSALQRLKTNLQSLNIDTSKLTIDTKDMDKFKNSLSSIADGAGKVQSTLLGLSDVLSAIGFDGAASNVSKFANALGGIINIVTGITSVVSTMSLAFSKAGVSISAAGITAQLSWGWIGLIAAGIALLVGGIIAISNASNQMTLDEKMAKAAETTDAAAEAANQAKEAYDQLFSDKESYDELQSSLDEAVKGTLEWKQALAEVNQQVLDLVNTYPQLTQYISEGANGQLQIEDKGWEELINTRLQQTQNASNSATMSQIVETSLDQEKIAQDVNDAFLSTEGIESAGITDINDFMEKVRANPENFIAKEITKEEFTTLPDEQKETIIKSAGYNMSEDLDVLVQDYLENWVGDNTVTVFSDELYEMAGYSEYVAQSFVNLADNVYEYDAAMASSQSQLESLTASLLQANASEELLASDSADSIINSLANTTSQGLGSSIEQLTSDLDVQYSLEELQQMYSDYTGIAVSAIDDSFRDNESALAQEIAKMQIGESYSQIMEYLKQETEDAQAGEVNQQFLDVLAGSAEKFTKEELESLQTTASGKDLDSYFESMAKNFDVTDANNSGQILDDFAALFGQTEEGLKELFSTQIQQMQNAQINTQQNIYKAMIATGVGQNSNNMQRMIEGMDLEQQFFLSESLDKVSSLGIDAQAALLNNVPQLDLANEEDLETFKQMQDLIDGINFDNPINSSLELTAALESGNTKLEQLASELKEASGESFSLGNQFQYMVNSADFTKVNEQLTELIEENGSITPDNIQELAQESEDLAGILGQGEVNATALAKAFNAIKLDGVNVEGFTTRVLEALSSVKTLDDQLAHMQSVIENFSPSADSGMGIDFLKSSSDTMNEFAGNYEFGNPQFQSYFEQVFGGDILSEVLKQEDPIPKFQEYLSKLEQWVVGDGYGFWRGIAEKSIDINGVRAYLDKNNDVVLGTYNEATGKMTEDIQMTTEEFTKALSEKMNISYDTAEMFVQNYASHSLEFAEALNENDFVAAMEKLATPMKDAQLQTFSVISADEVEAFASSMHMSFAEVKERIETEYAGSIKIVDWIDSETGTDLLGTELYEQIKTQLGLAEDASPLDLLATLNVSTEGGKIDFDELNAAMDELGLSEDQKAALTNEIMEALKAGTDGGTEYVLSATVNSFTGENGVLSTIQKEVEGADYSAITAQIDASYEAADADLITQKLAEGDMTGFQDALETAGKNASTTITSQITTDVNNLTFDELELRIRPKLTETSGTYTVNVNYSQPSQQTKKTYGIQSHAKGTNSQGVRKKEPSLVGEEGEELIQTEDGAYLVGTNGPEVVSLDKGDVVYSNEETKEIFKSQNNLSMPRYASGTKTKIVGRWGNEAKEEWSNYGKSDEKKTSSSSNKSSSSKSTSKSDAEEEAEIWENTFDWLYNLTQDINEELREREKLQTKYNRLIEDESKSATDILNNLREQEASLEQQRKLQQQMYNKRKQEMKNTLSEYKDVSQYATYDWSDNTVEINWDAINKVTDVDKGDRIEEYVSKLEEIESQMDEAQDALDNITDEIEELQKVGQDEYNNLESRVLDAIISREQEKIDKLSLIDESINDANNKLINSIQTNLDRIRQERQNQETEQSIEDNERRLAYLQQDTSGANALEIQRLQEELANQKQDYTDTLIDQKLSAIQEQNDKASEERQYQIELAQAQLEEMQKTGGFWDEAYRLIKEGTDATGKLVSNSELTKLLKEGEAWESMSNIQQMDWLSELENNTKAAMVYFSNQRQLEKVGKKSGKITFTNANGEKLTGTVQKDGSVKVTTSKGTYTYKEVFQNYDGTYETLESNPSFKASSSSSSSNKGSGSGSIKVGGLINAGKAKIYDYAGDKSGERQYFLNDPIYKVLSEKNGYLLTRWHKLNTGYTGWFKKSDVKAYAKGGLADFTGPAWLDGTKSKPELVLNAKDTQNFIQLKDILSSLLKGDSSATGNNGDNYFEIHIDVDNLNNDYDVEQLATKIKKMINDDARYRNVNSINLLR